ncbi:unnamed protein product [Discosporangium mesarthrocarpum]
MLHNLALSLCPPYPLSVPCSSLHQPTHMKIRNKPYPWMCSDCNFLDMKCFEECKASRA